METRSRLAICALALLTLIANANPYDTISLRNIFKLASPKENVAKSDHIFKPPPDIKLSGVAAFGSQKWVLLTKTDEGKAPRHLLMRAGATEDSLEIVSVDELAAVVKVRSQDELLELRLATNSAPKTDVAPQ